MQLRKAIGKIEEQHHAILFQYKANKSGYRKIIEKMENDMLQRKDPFPKFAADAFQIISGWKNCNRDTRLPKQAMSWHSLLHMTNTKKAMRRSKLHVSNSRSYVSIQKNVMRKMTPSRIQTRKDQIF